MMRQAIVLAVAALALVPDWATAFGRRRAARQEAAARPVCPPKVVWVSPCLPTFDVAPPPTAAHVVVPAPATIGPPSVKVEAEPAKPEPVKPVVAKPEAAKPEPAKPDPLPDPKPAPLPPLPFIPKPSLPDAVPPAAAVPVPAAVTPASAEVVPAPRAPSEPPLLPTVPRVPPTADAPKLPPLIPPLPKPEVRVAQASPISGQTPARVDVFTVDGPPPASPAQARKVVFFNHTDRDIWLTVAGKSTALPSRFSVSAEVPASFAWAMDYGEERKVEVPAASPGVDVVIRK